MTLIDVVVPVLGRPERAAPFVDSLAATVPAEAEVYLTVRATSDDQTTYMAWQDRLAGSGLDWQVGIGPPGRRSFACKVNDAYDTTSGAWLLLCGDDVAFHPGWWQALLPVMANGWAKVIGTNDNGWRADANSCVHPVVNRAYVDQRGASWDGPGRVCHEGYRHNYVDAEMHMVAHDRGVFAPAPECVIEHLHHSFGRAPVDATYEAGTAHLARDRRLYDRRRHTYRQR